MPKEFIEYPKWADTAELQDQYRWYLRIKKSLPQWRTMREDVSDLEQTLKEYELRNGIQTENRNENH